MHIRQSLHQTFTNLRFRQRHHGDITSRHARQDTTESRTRTIQIHDLHPTLRRPQIYDSIVPTFKLHNATRIRMISHSLQIELGRHRRPIIPSEERLCVCGEVETEKHFTQHCHLYTHIRHKYDINDELELPHILDTRYTHDYITELNDCREIFTRRTWNWNWTYDYGDDINTLVSFFFDFHEIFICSIIQSGQ